MDNETAKQFDATYKEMDALWEQLRLHSSADEHMRRAEEFRAKAEEIGEKTNFLRKELQSYLKQMHEETSRYVNVVAVIGYAGYFATWSFTKDILGKGPTTFVALMGMISVGLFVLWEMWVILAVRLRAINDLSYALRHVSVYEFEEIQAKLLKEDTDRIKILTPVQRLVFATSFLTVIAGTVTMMKELFESL